MTTLIEKAKKYKRWLNWLLIIAIALMELILIDLVIIVTFNALCDTCEIELLYKAIAIDIILLWIGLLIGYYTWAIYFYNINLGLTNEDWAEIRHKQQEGDIIDVRSENPHSTETLGLPDGTIRGTLALSLAVGALALLIASFGVDNTMPLNQLFVDTFDFFKTAFLMMIAFYFGNKSLQYLNYRGGMIKGGKGSQMQQNSMNSSPDTVSQPTLTPAVDPEIAGVKQHLNESMEGPDDIGKEKPTTSDFEKSGSKG